MQSSSICRNARKWHHAVALLDVYCDVACPAKSSRDCGMMYLWSCLTPVGLDCPTHSSRRACCRPHWPRNSSWWGQGEEAILLWSSGTVYHWKWKLLPPFWPSRKISQPNSAGWLGAPRGAGGGEELIPGSGWQKKEVLIPIPSISLVVVFNIALIVIVSIFSFLYSVSHPESPYQ